MRDEARILIPVPTSHEESYNRECWPQYAAAVRAAGGIAVEARLGLNAAELVERAKACDGVLLPGSPADIAPERYGQTRDTGCGFSDELRELCDSVLLQYAFDSGSPLLGICYGMQSLNVFLGGTLLQDISCVPVNHAAGPAVGVAHSVVVEASSRLGKILSGADEPADASGFARLLINSSHHQAIGVPGENLRVSARSSEDLTVEAVETGREGDPFVLGVQWHPERSTAISAVSRALFSCFVEAAAAKREEMPHTLRAG